MKKIIFPSTFRGHLARQQLLLKELKKFFDLHIVEYGLGSGNMADSSGEVTIFFLNQIRKIQPDLLLARGDRFEMLPIVMTCAYRGIPVAHIEGGDLSGTIDNKVRYAITHLSDFHFVTNEEAHARIISMGVPINRVWNFGSLDVEFASKVKPQNLRNKPYILTSYHPIEGEDEKTVDSALTSFKKYDIVKIASNKDYGREYGEELYSPEDYINLMRFASCGVGNSSSFLKEASILGTPVVLIGNRQKQRLLPNNVLVIPCDETIIKEAIVFQMKRTFKPDLTYYKSETSRKIAEKLKEVLG